MITQTIPQIFNRIHKAIVQDSSILNVVGEFLDYQAPSSHNIPDNIWQSAKLSDNGHWMDVTWGYLKPKLILLSKIAESVLVVPHSNASEGKLFSFIQNNKTEFRSRLNFQRSLNSFMQIKMSLPESLVSCYE